MPGRVVDQPGQVVAPRPGIEIGKAPECESVEVRICRLVLGGIEWHRLVVAVHGVGSAKRERGRSLGVGAEHLERAADDGCRAHTTGANSIERYAARSVGIGPNPLYWHTPTPSWIEDSGMPSGDRIPSPRERTPCRATMVQVGDLGISAIARLERRRPDGTRQAGPSGVPRAPRHGAPAPAP